MSVEKETPSKVPREVLDRIMDQWEQRVTHFRWKKGSAKRNNAQTEFAIGVLAAMHAFNYEPPVLITVSLLAGRDILEEHQRSKELAAK
jgi:hypothetical protein